MYCVDRNVRSASDAVELPGRHQAGYRPDVEVGQLGHALVDLAQLGDAVGGQPQARGRLDQLPAGEPAVEAGELGGHDGPDLVLLGGVVHVGDRLAGDVSGADAGDGRPPLEVGRVVDSRVIGGEAHGDVGHAPSVTDVAHNDDRCAKMADICVEKRSAPDARLARRCVSGSDGRMALDEIDRRIVQELLADGRLSVRELASRVHVSRATAHTRLTRLHDDGVITGYRAVVDPAALGLDVVALVLLNVDQHAWRRVRDRLLEVDGLEYLAFTTGGFDLAAIVRATDIAHLRDVVLVQIQAIAEVRNTQTIFVLDEIGDPGLG